MVNKVFPAGYSALGTSQWIDELMNQPNMLLIDTRLKPWSWRCDWREDALKAKYGSRYRQAGKYLGNLGYKDGYIKIADPATGIRGLFLYLNEGHDLILLCGCVGFDECHRQTIVDLLQREIDVEVIQPPKPGVETGMIRAFSTRPPYGDWLANPQRFIDGGVFPKRVENRSTDFTGGYRGPVLIHQSKTFESDAIDYWMRNCPSMANGALGQVASLEKKDYALGCIVGRAELVKVVEEGDESWDIDDPWFCGPYGLVLKDAKPIDPPIPYKGQLGLFSIDASVLQR